MGEIAFMPVLGAFGQAMTPPDVDGHPVRPADVHRESSGGCFPMSWVPC